VGLPDRMGWDGMGWRVNSRKKRGSISLPSAKPANHRTTLLERMLLSIDLHLINASKGNHPSSESLEKYEIPSIFKYYANTVLKPREKLKTKDLKPFNQDRTIINRKRSMERT